MTRQTLDLNRQAQLLRAVARQRRAPPPTLAKPPGPPRPLQEPLTLDRMPRLEGVVPRARRRAKV